MSKIGTKENLRQWLLAMMGMTHTRYSKLSTEAKLDIMSKYTKAKKGKTNEPRQSDTTQEGTPETVQTV